MDISGATEYFPQLVALFHCSSVIYPFFCSCLWLTLTHVHKWRSSWRIKSALCKWRIARTTATPKARKSLKMDTHLLQHHGRPPGPRHTLPPLLQAQQPQAGPTHPRSAPVLSGARLAALHAGAYSGTGCGVAAGRALDRADNWYRHRRAGASTASTSSSSTP